MACDSVAPLEVFVVPCFVVVYFCVLLMMSQYEVFVHGCCVLLVVEYFETHIEEKSYVGVVLSCFL